MHEIGHILGLNHPDKMSTVAGYPVGNNSYYLRAVEDVQSAAQLRVRP